MSVHAISWAMRTRVGSPTLKAVLVAVGNYADEDGCCWPTQTRLAEDTELSVRAVRNALTELEERGLIAREERERRDDKTRRSDLIQLQMRAPEHAARPAACQAKRHEVPVAHAAPAAATMRHVVPDHAAPRAGSYNAGTVRDPSEEPSVSCRIADRTKAYPAEFEAFWSGYPTDPNMGKREAAAEWRKLGEVDRDAAIASLPAFRAYCSARTDYRPIHACRYLAKRRFEGFVSKPSGSTSAPQAFVEIGTPQWEAWLRHRGVTSMPTSVRQVDGRSVEGWCFASEWPDAGVSAGAGQGRELAEPAIPGAYALCTADPLSASQNTREY